LTDLRLRSNRSASTPSEDSSDGLTLEKFIENHDLLLNGPALPRNTPSWEQARHPPLTDFKKVQNLAAICITHDFPTVEGLYAYIDQLDILDEERLRPGWDTYFMVSTVHSDFFQTTKIKSTCHS
jgi:dCMP deaminase